MAEKLKNDATKAKKSAKSNGSARATGAIDTASHVALGIGVGMAAGWYLERIIRSGRSAVGFLNNDDHESSAHAAAFRAGETDPDNIDQTRHAGPDSIRDRSRRHWNEVDHASDASFPASDPPSFSPGTA